MPKTYFCRKWSLNIIFRQVFVALSWIQTSLVQHSYALAWKIMNSLWIFQSGVIFVELAARKAHALAEESSVGRATSSPAAPLSVSCGTMRRPAIGRRRWRQALSDQWGGSCSCPAAVLIAAPSYEPCVAAGLSPHPAFAADSRPHSSCGCRAVQSSRSRVPPNSVRRLWVF